MYMISIFVVFTSTLCFIVYMVMYSLETFNMFKLPGVTLFQLT